MAPDKVGDFALGPAESALADKPMAVLGCKDRRLRVLGGSDVLFESPIPGAASVLIEGARFDLFDLFD